MKKVFLSALSIALFGMVFFLGTAIFPGYRAIALVVQKDVEQLTQESDIIVMGEVRNMESRWNNDRTLIYTYVTVFVSEYIKDDLTLKQSNGNGEQEIVVRILGGEVGDIGLTVSDTPEFKEGEEVFLFLRKGNDLKASLNVAGLFQGKYTVEDGMIKNKVLGLQIALEEFTSHITAMVNKEEVLDNDHTT